MARALLSLAVLFLLVSQLWTERGLRHPPGIIAPRAPRQSEIGTTEPFSFDGVLITPLARFEVEARVLSTERYWLDRQAKLAPVDLALGWGSMSDQTVLDRIDIYQRGRFYFWRSSDLPIAQQAVSAQSANMHLIPANQSVGRALKRVRAGQIVRFDGYLVQVEASDGWRWRSSLSRSDTGNGACEIVYVEHLETL